MPQGWTPPPRRTAERAEERLWEESHDALPPLARASDVETSHDAARANPLGKSTHRRACFEAHVRRDANDQHGLTDDEVALITGLTNAWKRCSDLRNAGLIEWLVVEGEPVKRRTRFGVDARVSVLTAYGRSVADGWPPLR